MQYSVDIILPTYKPTRELFDIIERLESQTYPVNKIIIMNTEEKYFERLFHGAKFLERFRNIEVHHLSAREFDHAGTRRKAVKYSTADVFVCMTQDAVPADKSLIQKLVDALMKEEDIAAAYARQLARPDCRAIEQFTRKFNYPDESCVKSTADIQRLGIKTFFCSNVCSAYNRKIYDALGGFEKRAIFNEDMIYAGHAVKAGKKIAYVAEAEVVHSHNFTCMQQFRRNFDLGVSQSDHPEVFAGISSESEGSKLVGDTIRHLWMTKKKRLIPYLFVSSGFKLIGYRMGKAYRRLPAKAVRWCSSSRNYWN
ncbi:MAG: glycosyltransferase family 2 protein [Lachnospiraceae bacterium]|nr:glycosyltransferase family 2 protein [Lachnospiraceae bacterium]